MNRRIRKKRTDAADRLLADGLRLYATRPRRGKDAEERGKLAVGLLSLTLGLALRDRIRRLPGPYFGAEVDPPRALRVEMPDETSVNANGLLLIRDRNGEEERAYLTFHLVAHVHRGRWAKSRVLMSEASRAMWEQAL
jgi:hypothetical protein